MIAICIGEWPWFQAGEPLLKEVVGGETDPSSLVVSWLVDTEVALGSRTDVDRNHEHAVRLMKMHCDEVGTPQIRLRTRAVVCAACVELDAAFPYPA
jgi:hypothetical protein